jgi:hypothetical protein
MAPGCSGAHEGGFYVRASVMRIGRVIGRPLGPSVQRKNVVRPENLIPVYRAKKLRLAGCTRACVFFRFDSVSSRAAIA